MKIVYIVGARPNFVKMAPVFARAAPALPDATHVLIHTGQHYDRAMSDVFLDRARRCRRPTTCSASARVTRRPDRAGDAGARAVLIAERP